MEITSEEENKVKRMKRTEDNLGDLGDNIKCTNIQIIGVPDEKKARVWEKFWRDYSWKFSQHGKGNSQVQEAQRVPCRINTRRNTPRHILIKLTKIKHKERILKEAREKQHIAYKGKALHLKADLSAETLQARREWQDTFKVRKGKILQTRILQPVRLSFRFEGDIKSFTDKQKLREFSTTKSVLQQLLKAFV